MKKRPFIISLLLFVILFSSFSVSFAPSVFDLDTDARFSGGFFPLSGKLKYSTEIIEMLPSYPLNLSLTFHTGLKHRVLIQNPDTGELLDQSSYNSESARNYQVQYIYMVLDLNQALFKVNYLDSDILRLRFGIEANFEGAYERIGWMTKNGEEESTFYNSDFTPRYTSFEKVRELRGLRGVNSGYRQLTHTGLMAEVSFNYYDETRMKKNGIWGDLSLHYLPSFFPFHDSLGSSYFTIKANGGLSLNLLEVKQFSIKMDSEVLDMFSINFETEFHLRGVWGKYIPQYALEYDMWNTHISNTEYLIANKTKLMLLGPQILEDVYPLVSLFSDIAFSFGRVANTSFTNCSLSGSIGLEATFNIFDTLYLYASAGYVYSSSYVYDKGFKWSIGAKLGL